MKLKHKRKLEGLDFIREKVRIRDNHTCQHCGLIWNGKGKRFDAHHLDDELEGDVGRKYKNNPIDRMITLCHKCHFNTDSVKKRILIGLYGKEESDKFIKRFHEIKKLRESGMFLKTIASTYDISISRVREILEQSYPQI
jgi:5-methylcytosine-specific restriction endonuclease McrA